MWESIRSLEPQKGIMAKKSITPEETPVEESATEQVEAASEETPIETTSEEAVAESTDLTEEAAEKTKSKKKAKAEAPKKAAHGKKHQDSVALVDKNKSYPLAEALELIKKTSYSKFDGSVDLHVRLSAAKKNEDAVRGTVTLPHGTGRERKVVVITDEMIAKIEKGWLDFDIAVATPAMMPKLAKLAKILGPKGLMPNPKSGTVTETPEKALEELKGGRVEFKADTLGNIHQSIGKVSWADTKLTENLQAFVAALPKPRVKSVSVAPTMGAGVKVQL